MSDASPGRFEKEKREVQDFTPTYGESQSINLEPDSILFDRFKVIKLLGRGGMGSVYKVQHLHLHTEYALKCLNRQQHNDASWRRFENEARAANKLDHPNLIRVHDSGLLPDGQPYFVMDLVDGPTLADEIRKAGCLPLNVALKIFIQVGFALSYAHERGVIHRDIKPTNIMLVKNTDGTLSNSVKVVDFGIAKLTGQEEFNQQTLTRTGEIFGSPLYMSPEQCMGVAVDHRSDLYSFGCVLYEALTGAPPFVGENALSTMMKHQSDDFLPLKQASMGIEFPEQVDLLIRKLLAKNPEDRYSNASLLTADLVAVEQSLHTGATMALNAEDLQARVRLGNTGNYFATKKSSVLTWCVLLLVYFFGLVSGMFVSRLDTANVSKPVSTPTNDLHENTLIPMLRIGDKGELLVDDGAQKAAEPISAHQLVKPESKLLPYRRQFFSDGTGRYRTFSFPKQASLGRIRPMNTKSLALFDARGDITITVPICLYADRTLLENPELISKFRPDELETLNVSRSDLPLTPVLSRIIEMTELRGLELGGTKLSSQDVKLIDRVSGLTKLSVSRTSIKPKEILRLHRLEQLLWLDLCGIDGVKPILKRLVKNDKIDRLSVGDCNLDIDDLSWIAKIPNLHYLDLTRNKSVNDETISIIAKSKSIRSLDLEGCHLTRKCIPALKSMNRVLELRMSTEVFSDDPTGSQETFERELPNCSFNWRLGKSSK